MKTNLQVDFDERVLTKQHILKAITAYNSQSFKHAPARSAFLLHAGRRLPAKFLLRLAFQIAKGVLVRPETLTGGRASVRVLRNLGFNAIYDKPVRVTSNRNPIKNARREAFKQALMKRWGPVECEHRFPDIQVPDLENRASMPIVFKNILTALEQARGFRIKGRKGLALAFDLYLPKVKAVIEFDERQHFTPLRAVALRVYPAQLKLGFDKKRWIRLAEKIRAGDNSPAYRDEQRAFYDAIRDIYAVKLGLRPVIRIFEEDVLWEKANSASTAEAVKIFSEIEKVL